MITSYIMLSLLAYQELQKGRLVTKPNANHVHYKDAYEWMTEQLNHRTKKPTDVVYPLWCWLNPPNPNTWSHKEPEILIEFKIDKIDILFSDYLKWHHILNKDNHNVDVFNISDSSLIQGVFWELNKHQITNEFIYIPIGTNKKKIKKLKKQSQIDEVYFYR